MFLELFSKKFGLKCQEIQLVILTHFLGTLKNSLKQANRTSLFESNNPSKISALGSVFTPSFSISHTKQES